MKSKTDRQNEKESESVSLTDRSLSLSFLYGCCFCFKDFSLPNKILLLKSHLPQESYSGCSFKGAQEEEEKEKQSQSVVLGQK